MDSRDTSVWDEEGGRTVSTDQDNDGTADRLVLQSYDAWGNGTWWGYDSDADGATEMEIAATFVCTEADPVRVPEAIDPYTLLAY